jgi:hypothetical protein
VSSTALGFHSPAVDQWAARQCRSGVVVDASVGVAAGLVSLLRVGGFLFGRRPHFERN